MPKGEHHANGPAEKGIGDIDRITKAIMADKNIPSRFWEIVAEHCAMLSGSLRNSIARISGLISLTSPGIFLGYATYNNIYGAVLFAEKALVVGRLQIAFDPNFFPRTDKSSDNPRYKFLHSLLGRGPGALDAAADNAVLDDAMEVDLQDSSSAPNPPSDADDAVSSDDDDASKALFSELLQSSPVPAFNPLRADPLPANQVPYPAAAPTSAGGIKAAAPQLFRLCSIALLLTRYRMRLSVVVLDRAKSLRASLLARCSSVRPVASRLRLLALLPPLSRLLSTSCFLSVAS